MAEILKIRMSDFDLSTFVEMVVRGAYIPVVVPPKYNPNGKQSDDGSDDGADGGENYVIPIGQLPMRISELPLTGDGSAERPFTIDREALKELVSELIEEVVEDSVDRAVRKYLKDMKILGYGEGSDDGTGA